jgi:hypothetical protein
MLPYVRRRAKTAPRHLAGLACLLLAGAAAPLAADNPNQPQGFGLDRSYHGAPALPDQVDLFSGRLSVTLPIGPFTLAYNNNVWRYLDAVENGQPVIRAQPDRLQNSGLGWHLGWGELYPPSHWYNDTVGNQWLYVGDDGSHRVFYGALHRLEDDGDGTVYYTRDNSYLRLRNIVPGSTWDIEFPDGTTRRFVKGPPGYTYRLTKAWDRHGSATDPDITITYSPDDKLRTLTDRLGRSQYVHLAGDTDVIDGHNLSWMIRVITKVDVQGPEGQRLEYDFSYRNIPVDVSCKNTSQKFESGRRCERLQLRRFRQPAEPDPPPPRSRDLQLSGGSRDQPELRRHLRQRRQRADLLGPHLRLRPVQPFDQPGVDGLRLRRLRRAGGVIRR